jgi:hypothetical protein
MFREEYTCQSLGSMINLNNTPAETAESWAQLVACHFWFLSWQIFRNYTALQNPESSILHSHLVKAPTSIYFQLSSQIISALFGNLPIHECRNWTGFKLLPRIAKCDHSVMTKREPRTQGELAGTALFCNGQRPASSSSWLLYHSPSFIISHDLRP